MDEVVSAIAFRVRGKVQGVAFRWFTRKSAEQLGVTGWVRNRADGGVEGEAYGSVANLERLLGVLREGPPSARVEDLSWRAITGEATPGFEIRF